MHELLLKYYTGEITATEKKQLFDLIENNEELKKEFIELQSLKTFSLTLPMQGDKQEAEIHLHQFKQNRRKKQLLLWSGQFIRYAAVIFITVILTWLLIPTSSQDEELADLPYQEFITPAGQRAQIKLEDGTTVWLNAQTTLRYPLSYSRTERRVELDGEAFFEVQSNKDIPFIVSTEHVDIRVHGTTFNVFAYKEYGGFNTALTEGSIELCKRDDPTNGMMLQPNECAKWVDGHLVKSEFNNRDFLLWKDGIFAFDDEPFHEIIHKLQLYYDVRIEIKNEQVYQYKFSGKFRQRDGVESVLNKLSKIYSFRFIKDEQENSIVIL